MNPKKTGKVKSPGDNAIPKGAKESIPENKHAGHHEDQESLAESEVPEASLPLPPNPWRDVFLTYTRTYAKKDTANFYLLRGMMYYTNAFRPPIFTEDSLREAFRKAISINLAQTELSFETFDAFMRDHVANLFWKAAYTYQFKTKEEAYEKVLKKILTTGKPLSMHDNVMCPYCTSR